MTSWIDKTERDLIGGFRCRLSADELNQWSAHLIENHKDLWKEYHVAFAEKLASLHTGVSVARATKTLFDIECELMPIAEAWFESLEQEKEQ